MKSKILYKAIVDILMLVILIFLMSHKITGEKLHKIMGRIFFLLIILHIFFNRTFIKNIFNFKKNKSEN